MGDFTKHRCGRRRFLLIPISMTLVGLSSVSCSGYDGRNGDADGSIHLHPNAIVGEWGRRIPARALRSPSEPYRAMVAEFKESGVVEMIFSEHPEGELTPDSIWERTITKSTGRWYVLSPMNENVKLCVAFDPDPPDCWDYSVQREVRNDVAFVTLNLNVPGRGIEQWMRSTDRIR